MPRRIRALDRRVLRITLLALVLGVIASGVAWALVTLIGLITNLVFYGRFSLTFAAPVTTYLGHWVIVMPVLGGLVIGIMARWGSTAIRGHGIPEAMEQILLNESRIPPRITWLKPLSSAIAIGTGGPFGAEGPIIATGGALGSLMGQVLRVSADERKVLLAAGAAGGMAAIFSAPVSSVLLAIELLLFERRARSLIPVALAAVAATGMRYVLLGSAPVFPMPNVALVTLPALCIYVLVGCLVGFASIGVTRLTYAIEDGFEKLPVHWMWWPAIGGLAVGVIGYVMPATLGVGYTNIDAIIGGRLGLWVLFSLCLLKLASWSIALGSGTSGGTLAPLFTIGGALGGVLGICIATHWPGLGVNPGLAALIGMAAMFAGASRAFMTSVVFAFETTQQPHSLLPLLGGCAAAYLVSGLLMRRTIMTEKIERRGVRVPSEYSDDYLDRIPVGEVSTRNVSSLHASQTVGDVARWLISTDPAARYGGFPVLNDQGAPLGVLMRRTLLDPLQPADARLIDLLHGPLIVVDESHSLREAADHMVDTGADVLIVVASDQPSHMEGILTKADLLNAHERRLRQSGLDRK
nr:chloride channel protein [Dyella sp. A6]